MRRPGQRRSAPPEPKEERVSRTVGATRRGRVGITAALLLPLLVGLASGHRTAHAGNPPSPGGSVTVSNDHDLVDQTVHVSWSGFRPSSAPVVTQASTMYVVRVYQCRGTAPAGPQDCYGSSEYDYPGKTDASATQPDGPPNFVDAATDAAGKGGVDIETRTSLESSTLGCDAEHACSLVVVPNYGDPTQHANDFIYATNAYMDAAWSWARHSTIPISFAATGASCPLGDASVGTVGSPLSARAITSWQPAICQGTNAVDVDYTAVGEPQARSEFLAGSVDVALTSLPADPSVTAKHAYTYAPINIGGISVAFHVDDTQTGQPINDMKLNARLVAKLLTESYGGVGFVAPGAPVGPGNPATAGNPYSIFSDPEFRQLNPGHHWPASSSDNPLVVSGNTDLIWTLTHWMASDPAAATFLSGTPDPWKMHVNTNFKGAQYPSTSIELRDNYPASAYLFIPINGLDLVARSLVANQPSATSPTPDALGRHAKAPQELPGQRSLLAIVDTASAAAFNLPQATLKNAAGGYPAPTATAMTAATTHLTTNADKVTQQVDLTVKDPAVYPLTMITYAMLPTSAASTTTISQVVRMLSYIAGPGQQPSTGPGGLPAGYLPLTSAMKTSLEAASAAVRTQSGTRRPTTPPATPPPSTGDPRHTTTTPAPEGPRAASTAAAGVTSAAGTSGGAPATTPTSTPASASGGPGTPATVRVTPQAVTAPAVRTSLPWLMTAALPLVLITGLVAALGGPLLVGVARGRLPAWVARTGTRLRKLAPHRHR
jgi:ABC-type phosphate transport system substrate-binding protein